MFHGVIQNLIPEPGEVVRYHLLLNDQPIRIDDWVGRQIEIEPTGSLACVFCGRSVKKLFANGSCYPCFRDLPHNDLCIVRPELCHYDTCRDQAWAEVQCMVPTHLYLAASSSIKVGISRNLPGRWLQQGAVRAMAIATLANRKAAGELEAYLAQEMPDKTNWRKMLQGQVDPTPLAYVAATVRNRVPPHLRRFLLENPAEQTFAYPGAPAAAKIVPLHLETGPVRGRLIGLRGQYLILDRNGPAGPEPGVAAVLNIPKFLGYGVNVAVAPAASAAVAG